MCLEAEMAGIHLPDIGKLGIRVATGMRDRKKVGPSNMAEGAKLRTLSSKLDNEKNERYRSLKKEERRMKRKKQKIDKRREDIGLNLTREAKGRLPAIVPHSVNGTRRRSSARESSDQNLKSQRNSSGAAIFPIQDELGFGDHSDNNQMSALPPNDSPVRSPTLRASGKVFLPSLESEGMTHRKAKKRKVKRDSYSKEMSGYHEQFSNSSNAHLEQEKQKIISCDLNSRRASQSDEVVLINESQSPRNGAESGSFSVEGALTNQKDDRKSSSELQDRKQFIQQSLEEAFLAIQACRYIRTPSKQTVERD